jgi:hypothetical protein
MEKGVYHTLQIHKTFIFSSVSATFRYRVLSEDSFFRQISFLQLLLHCRKQINANPSN